MYFKRLSLQGFKSFADPVSIEFDRGITCVVGPNGSGKSNISDALRWVLGEQSPRMLRGGRMDEVIFAGTDHRKSRGMAEVTLAIDNSDGSLSIDFEEVSITRRMYRSGESEYYINGSQCRLRDIRELIMDTGIGVDGYSLIGQGKISEIISGKPESRREIFEEAAGIVKYRSRKAETERKLEKTAANLERVNDIVSELEKRIGPLRAESERAVKYKEYSELYRENEINVVLRNIENAERQSSDLQNELITADALISEKEAKREAIEKEILECRNRLEEVDREDLAERDRIMQFSSDMGELRNRIKVYDEKIASLSENVKLYSDERLILTEKLNREEKNSKELARRLSTLGRNSAASESELAAVTGQLESINAKVRDADARFDEGRNMIYDLSMISSSKNAEIAGIKQLGDSLRRRLEEISHVKPDEEDMSARQSYANAVRKHDAVMEAKREAESRIEKSKLQLEKYILSEERSAKILEESRISLSKEQTRKHMLQQLEDSYEGYNGAVRYIMTQSGINGLYGTAGELISVPRGYETAVETAMGARMQNIVCRDEICADKAIRILKTRRIGRLTFLPLDTLRVTPVRSAGDIADQPGYVGIASECVTFDEKYRKAVEYLLGGIIIVRDLDSAVSIAKNSRGFRFVTLEGEFINPAGAITGGAYKNSNAGIFDRRNRLNECDSSIFQLETAMKEAEDSARRASDSRAAEEKVLAEAEADSRRIEIEAMSIENDINEYSIRMKRHDENVDRNVREKLRVEEELRENENILSSLAREKNDIDAKIEKLKSGVEIAGSDSEESRRILDELQEKHTAAKVEVQSVKGEIANVMNLSELVAARIAEIKNDIGEKAMAEKAALAEQQTLHDDIEKVNDAIKAREQVNSKHSDRLRYLRDEKENLNKEIKKHIDEKDEIDRTLINRKSLRHELSIKAEGLGTKIDNWKNRLWDDFETSYIQAVEFRKLTFNLSDGIKESKRLRDILRKIGSVNMSSIEEYRTVKERYEFLTDQRKDLNEAIASLKQIITETDLKIRTGFKSSFDAIRINFENIFTELFGGGKAELRIDNTENILEANIDIVVQPPGKKLQNMNLLSGGEKTMTAIALMFAVLKAKPTPFCILDEVEAALDEANIERFADYLKNFENIQFVLVTHQKVTMEHANVLYGVTMPEKGISKVLSLKLEDAEKMEELSL